MPDSWTAPNLSFHIHYALEAVAEIRAQNAVPIMESHYVGMFVFFIHGFVNQAGVIKDTLLIAPSYHFNLF